MPEVDFRINPSRTRVYVIMADNVDSCDFNKCKDEPAFFFPLCDELECTSFNFYSRGGRMAGLSPFCGGL